MSGGSPFQTFYLMFKSNAKEAQKDMKDTQKVSDETTKKIKKTKEESTELGKAFTSAVEDATRALAAYVSFQAFRGGIINAQEFNRTLTVQTKLWNQNANEINAYGSAVKAAGGDMQGFFGWYDRLRQQNASLGRSTLPLGQLINHIRGQVRGLSPEAAQQVFQQYGLGDAGAQTLLRSSDAEFEKSISSAQSLANNTEAGSKAAIEFGTAWDNLTTSLTKFWTTVNTVILPPLSFMIEKLGDLFNVLADNKAAATAFFVGLAAAATAFTAAIPAIVAGFGTISSAALAAAAPLAAFLAPFLAIVAGASLLINGASAGGEAIGNWINSKRSVGSKGIGSGSAMNYLMSKYGLDAAHAAGIVANLNAESGGNPNAIGDNGRARGLFQWHPDRRENILAGTGIDVANASVNQQLDAAMWELKDRGQYNSFLSQKGAAAAGAYFSQNFEGPAGGVAEALSRGRAAMDIASTTPFASQGGGVGSLGGGVGGGVNIGKIEVHTQATDAAGIARDFHGELQRQIGGLYSQNNDAVAY